MATNKLLEQTFMSRALTVSKKRYHILFLSLAITVISAVSAESKSKSWTPVDLIITNGHILTMERANPEVEAIAVTNGRISYIGTTAGANRYADKTTQRIDAHGGLVLPGFHDSHVHLIDGGVELSHCDLSSAATQQSILTRIEEFAKQQATDQWLRGGGWSLPIFEKSGPTREMLDKIVPDRPVYLESQDHHSAWVNSRALELSGVSAKTPDPPGGRIERTADGAPSGTLRESAMELVSKHMPVLTEDELTKGLLAAQEKAAQFGITSIYDAACDERLLATYRRMESDKRLTVKVTAAMRCRADRDHKQVQSFVAARKKYNSNRVHVNAAKIFVDGVVEAKTAALLQPYVGTASTGVLNFRKPQLNKLAAELVKNGFQIHMHAIGDGAVRAALDAVAFADPNNARDLRHHIAHLELVDPADLPRFSRLQVTPNLQAFWAQRDKYITDLTEPFVGPERSSRLYPFRSLQRNSQMIVGGSDWPVSSLNPLDAIEVAVTRRNLGDTAGGAWLPKQAVDLDTMLAAYTINGAKNAHAEQNRGSVKIGKAADLIILDKDIRKIPPSQIHTAKVILTLVNGTIVYSATPK